MMQGRRPLDMTGLFGGARSSAQTTGTQGSATATGTVGKAPVTSSRVFTTELFKFSAGSVIARKNLIFFIKKRACQGVLTAIKVLIQGSHGVLLSSAEFVLTVLCELTTLSMRLRCSHNACTAFSRRFGVLKVQ